MMLSNLPMRQVLFFILALVFATLVAATPVSEIVVDAGSGKTLFGFQAMRVRPPASLTKMMTLLLALEAISSGRLRTDDKLVMTRRGARQPPSRLGLTVGGSMSVEAAMRVVAVVSANDVAVALAERVGGGEAAFVRAMIVAPSRSA